MNPLEPLIYHLQNFKEIIATSHRHFRFLLQTIKLKNPPLFIPTLKQT
ncbi:hypothetical protein HC081234_01500 [Helicobacter cinaedi]|nr:hypothetical protein HC081234_01500 [Helicobacter cinaedi]